MGRGVGRQGSHLAKQRRRGERLIAQRAPHHVDASRASRFNAASIGTRRQRHGQGKEHHYDVEVRWTGNLGEGTSSYKSYARTHDITSGRKPVIPGSSDPAFRGDQDCWNPEDLMVAAVSACHKLWSRTFAP